MVDGPARVGLVQRLPDDRGGARRSSAFEPTTAGWRPTPSRASSRRWSSRAARPDRIVTLRARTLSAVGPDGRRASACVERERVRAGPAARGLRRSRSPASGWSGCGRRPSPSTRRSWRAHDAGRHPPRQLPRRRRLRRRRARARPRAAGCRAHPRRGGAGRRRRPRRRRRALGPRDRRLRPPPARRRGRARQRHPLRELRARLARVRRVSWPGGGARTRSTSGSCRASTPTTPARTSRPRCSRASGRCPSAA